MIKRQLQIHLAQQAKKYPVVSLTGPRQSGKTTLAQQTFSKYQYVTLESLDQREFAQQDPRGFLAKYHDGVIIDEVQRCPELFSYIQEVVDQRKKPGQFILTGSQNFLLMESITQSLAGRVSIQRLLPFSWHELHQKKLDDPINAMLVKGFYPRIYDQNLNAYPWYGNYIQTYIQRDVRSLKNVGDLSIFQRFLRLCAGRHGQILNYSNLADDCGVSYNTIKSWISILEASYIVYLLPPYYKNFNKRIIKTPKLYFYDSGLVAYLLGIRDENMLDTHPMRGAIFEGFVMSEVVKHYWHHNESADLYFWRDQVGKEIDLLLPNKGTIEIKSAKTFNASFLDDLIYFRGLSGKSRDILQESYVIFDGDQEQQRSDHYHVLPWRQFFKSL